MWFFSILSESAHNEQNTAQQEKLRVIEVPPFGIFYLHFNQINLGVNLRNRMRNICQVLRTFKDKKHILVKIILELDIRRIQTLNNFTCVMDLYHS